MEAPDLVTSRSVEDDRAALQGLVAQGLRDLGLPDQRFDIQASYLTFSSLDLGIRLVWPATIQFQGKPTGVIQLGSPKRSWNPETRCVITFARVMEPARLKKEIGEWCRTMAAMAREAYEKRGGEWPRGWPRLQVRGAGTVNAMPTRPGTISQQGKVRAKRPK